MQDPSSHAQEESTQQPDSKLADYIGKVLSLVEELAPEQRCHVLYAAFGLT
jgi:hypothetical protein